MPDDRRTRKRLATRQGISDAATELFILRGFDNVTIDDIAAAADVGRMTVFSHFRRKEDMFFDRDEEGRDLIREALLKRDAQVAPLEALRLLCHRCATQEPLYVSFTPESRKFIETIENSPTLIARARAIRDELAQFVAATLTESVGTDPADHDASLLANLLTAAWSVAFIRAHRVYRESRNVERATATFLEVIDRGTRGVEAAAAGTPYAQGT